MSLTQSASTPSKTVFESPVIPAVKQTPVRSVPFTKQYGFRRTVVQRVEAFLKANELSTRDLPAMYVKSAICLSWWAISYGLMLYSGVAGWHFLVALFFALSFGLATGSIGFNIMHDANHNGYSDRPWVNRLLGLTVELVGLSNFIWRQQHNIWHHTYTNIAGLDEGLEMDGWVRNSPRDIWKPIHRFQHLYAPMVYALAGVGLLLGRNFQVYFTGRSGDTFRYPPMSRNDKIVFWIGRFINLMVYLVLPALVFGIGGALIIFAVTSMVTGFVMAVILQMAHVMDDVEFPEPTGDPLKIENEWAIHEVQTTSNFAPNNPILNWYVGGLNYQIEHHLFPHMCHLVYPKIAPIVKATCEEFGLTYRCYPTFRAALKHHWQSLREFGRQPV
ncbi:fatty acid desaturase [Candidatus Roseilinea sp. NK_OTU-006]|uniref:fatty acid desaturase n=1 Tax=Candidatus Roseilinea sp. NK_OTU-006 TaxID=2704250 RepID=UPI00145E092C|nr:acyl-CoA desaturase [Candidatus Roseilinea sp. NK_OTU-006]